MNISHTTIKQHSGRLLLCWVLFLSTACTQHPLAKIDMPVVLPEHFSMTGKMTLQDQWWLMLEDDQLSSLIDSALKSNLDVQIAWDRLALAQAQSRKVGAPLMPSLDTAAGIQRQVRKTNNSRNTDSTYNMSLGASYEIDLWGKLRSARDAAVYD